MCIILLFSSESKAIKKKLTEQKVFIFLDEIQKLPDFQNQIKVFYDLYPNLKLFLSGSTSLFIRKKAQESLAGRILNLFLTPLNFEEYLLFSHNLDLLDRPSIFQKEIERQFEIYLTSQFIDSLNMGEIDLKKDYFKSIIKKIIFEDIPSIFPIEYPEILMRLVKIIAQHPGIYLNYQNLANDLEISNKTVSQYIFFLEEAFLIKKVYNFSRNLVTSEKKMKRCYLASPSFSWALADIINMGKLVENGVISMKDYRFFWRDAYKHEIDFIHLESDEKIVPVEVKYKGIIGPDDLKHLHLFSKRFQIDKAIVLSKDVQRKELTSRVPNLTIEQHPVFFY